MPSGLLRVDDTKQNSADRLLQQVEDSIPLPQREAAGFHFAPLSCFSQCHPYLKVAPLSSQSRALIRSCFSPFYHIRFLLTNYSVTK